MATETKAAPKAQTFRLKTALLSAGRTTRFIASTGTPEHALSVAIKCYAEGGENEFHTHRNEDHTFVVLQGSAVFHSPDGPDITLGRNEGILLPGGAFYKFEAVPGEPLVQLRVGNVDYPLEGQGRLNDEQRVMPDGTPIPSNSAANKGAPGVPIPGAFYE